MTSFFKTSRHEIEWGGRILSLETGRLARQADGAVLAQYGETSVLCTVVGVHEVSPGQDFFPLSVHYQEKAFAVGRIPGGYGKREGRPTEKETLTSRLIDRPIRPLFPETFHNEVQIVCTVLTHDLENDPSIVAMIGASAALSISGLPFHGPIAGASVGYMNGAYVLNPKLPISPQNSLDLVVAGTAQGVLMVESEAQELTEDVMLGAVAFGHENLQPVLELINKLKADAGKAPWPVPEASEDYKNFYNALSKEALPGLRAAYDIPTKADRYHAIGVIKANMKQSLDVTDEKAKDFSHAFEAVKSSILRGNILESGKRVDGRDLKTVRPIDCQVGVLSRTHGSALFTRGETQALAVATLGTSQDEQFMDALEGEYRERFLLHYNFPPFSVNEVGRMSSPGRREIGHGKLAWRALRPLIPSKDKFPYTIRIVSEILESNGSSSMATVCGGSLAMMDAGIPLTRPVAGIAMGLIKEGNKFAVLTDILGDEDHLGDMDFKVAGTEKGITALQMDIKITSITPDIMHIALEQARVGRLHILGEMAKALSFSRNAVSDHAPKMVSMAINKDRIRDLIGPGGKMIRSICEESGARVDIDDEGIVNISALDQKSIDIAKNLISNIACDPEVGQVYTGKVVKIMEFGAFVNFMGRDGLVHISELANERVAKVTDILQNGDLVNVKVLGFDDRGKIKLSVRGVEQPSQVAISVEETPSPL